MSSLGADSGAESDVEDGNGVADSAQRGSTVRSRCFPSRRLEFSELGVSLPLPLFHALGRRLPNGRVLPTRQPALQLGSSNEELPSRTSRKLKLASFGAGEYRFSPDTVPLEHLLHIEEIGLCFDLQRLSDNVADDLAEVANAEGHDHGFVREC